MMCMSCSSYICGFYDTISFCVCVQPYISQALKTLMFNRFFGLAPQVAALLEVLPNRLTADVLEQLRLSKQALV